jgi:hypothetical protein
LREEESEQERKKTRPYYSGICLTLGTHGAWPHAEGLIDGFYCNLRKFGMDSILHMQDGTLCVCISNWLVICDNDFDHVKYIYY